jgi:hypothetical protein
MDLGRHAAFGGLAATGIAGAAPGAEWPEKNIAWVGPSPGERSTDAPAEILDRTRGAVQAPLDRDAVKRVLLEEGAKVELDSRADYNRFVDQEIVRWNAIVKAANIQLEQAQ